MVRCGWIVAVAGVLSCLVASGSAAERWSPEQNTCNQQADTVSIVECLQGRTKVWDQRLNQVWRMLNAALAGQPQRLAALKAAEQAWIKFKEANCAYYYSQDGSIKQVETAGCFLQMTQNRAIELQGELPQ